MREVVVTPRRGCRQWWHAALANIWGETLMPGTLQQQAQHDGAQCTHCNATKPGRSWWGSTLNTHTHTHMEWNRVMWGHHARGPQVTHCPFSVLLIRPSPFACSLIHLPSLYDTPSMFFCFVLFFPRSILHCLILGFLSWCEPPSLGLHPFLFS